MKNYKYNNKTMAQLEGNDFQSLHNDIVGLTTTAVNVTETMVGIFTGKKSQSNYLAWLTDNAKKQGKSDVTKQIFAGEMKGVQRIINGGGGSCQRQMQGIDDKKKPLTKKVSLTMAKLPMVENKLKTTAGKIITKAMCLNNEYVFVYKAVKVSKVTKKDKVKNFLKANNISPAKLIEYVNQIVADVESEKTKKATKK